jgi:hypothetical protein
VRKRIIGIAVVALVGGLACDDAATSGADGGVVQIVPDQDMGSADPLRAFCDAQAQAKCGWAFECLQPGAIRGIFGLDGGDVAACAAADADACYADVSAREARGTLDFSADAVATCVNKLSGAPCLPGDPSDWVGDWYTRVATVCNSVVRGNVPAGGACTERTDCQDVSNICKSGACAAAAPADIMRACGDEVRSRGTLLDDSSCPGEVCLALGNNAQEMFGTCTVDCRYGTGCPSGSYCLQQQAIGQPPSWYCTWPCSREADCQGGLVCAPINADDPDTQHCTVTAPE